MTADTFMTPDDLGALATPTLPGPRTEGDPALTAWAQEAIWTAASTSDRNGRLTPGPSGLGSLCDRQMAYGLAGITPSSLGGDPLVAWVGTGVHHLLAEHFRALNVGTWRYLVEHPCSLRGCRGSLDLYDRRTGAVVDWKTKTAAKIAKVRRDGIGRGYRWQVQTYAAMLVAAGEDVRTVACAFIPTDTRVSDVWVWSEPFAPEIAAAALDRRDRIAARVAADGPGSASPSPSALCPWCRWHRPGWAGDVNTACPGPTMPLGRTR